MCYLHVTQPASYHAARRNCTALSGNTALAMPKTQQINQEILDSRSSSGESWIGLDDWQHEGVYVWTDGAYLSGWDNWDNGQPGNTHGREHCAALRDNGRWNDRPCDEKISYVCQLDPSSDAEACVNSDEGIIDMDGEKKSCEDFITENGNFLCDENLVRKLCCLTCRDQETQEVEIKYPDNFIMEVYIVADQAAFEVFKSQLHKKYPYSDKAARVLMKQSLKHDTMGYMKTHFPELNLEARSSGIEVLDFNIHAPWEDGDYVSSHTHKQRFAQWFTETGRYSSKRFDLAVINTGLHYRDCTAENPCGGPAGRASGYSTCHSKAAATVRYWSSDDTAYDIGINHEFGHLMSLKHKTGGVMYGPEEEGKAFMPNQIKLVHKYLNRIWNGEIASDARNGTFPQTDTIQQNFIGTNCLRDAHPVPINSDLVLPAKQKTPDVLCENAYGNTSYFCQTPYYYNYTLPYGDTVCSNLWCVIGHHWECARLDQVTEVTEGMECAPGKTCQSGSCLSSGSGSTVCPSGYFGSFCSKSCHCKDTTGDCDHVSGVCSSGCDSQWTGDNCQLPACPEHWSPLESSGKCYLYINEAMTYKSASTKCHSLLHGTGETYLAMPKTRDIQDKLRELSSSARIWIGLDDTQTEGIFLWADGSQPNWSQGLWNNFAKKQPNNAYGNENCAEIGTNGKWNDRNCDGRQRFVCEHIPALTEEHCLNGDQKFVTTHDGQTDTCAAMVARYGKGVCAGDFPVRGMKDVCCLSCRGSLVQDSDSTPECPYIEGVFPSKDGTSLTCAHYLDTSASGNQLCRDAGFRKFCCKTCPQKFTVLDLDQCEYGDVNFLQGEVAGQTLSNQTCEEALTERGPGLCAVTLGAPLDYGSPIQAVTHRQTVADLCCSQCQDFSKISQRFLKFHSTATGTCVGTVVDGKIQSPNYPDKYPNGAHCDYQIVAPVGQAIRLSFDYFNLESCSNPTCRCDAFVAYDGPDANAIQLGGLLCGNIDPEDIISTGNQMFIRFYSDHSSVMKGFQATYSPGCLFDDGKIWDNGHLVSCADFTAKSGYSKCAEESFGEICCNSCTQGKKELTEFCGSDWSVSMATESCYKFSKDKEKFVTARVKCQEMGADLAMPKTLAESVYWWTIRKEATKEYTSIADLWYGLKSMDTDDGLQWKWLDGETLGWADWIVDDTAPKKDNCAFVTSAGWGRAPCSSTKKHFVCVKSASP